MIQPDVIQPDTVIPSAAAIRSSTPIVAVNGVTTTENSVEFGVGPFRIGVVKRHTPDSLKITFPNGVTVEATGALAAELWRNRAGFMALGDDDDPR